MPRTKRPTFSTHSAIAWPRLAGLGLAAILLSGPARATIDVQEEGAPPSGSSLGAIQQAVSNTVQAMEGLGLAIDPVEARQKVREALLTAADL